MKFKLLGFAGISLLVSTVIVKDIVFSKENITKSDSEPYVNINYQDNSAKSSDENMHIDVYDENDLLIYSYSDSQIERMVTAIPENLDPNATSVKYYDLIEESDQSYNFLLTTFSEHITIGKNKVFNKPKSLTIKTDLNIESMTILLESSGHKVGSVIIGNISGDILIPLEKLVAKEAGYTIKLVNNTKGDRVLLLSGSVKKE